MDSSYMNFLFNTINSENNQSDEDVPDDIEIDRDSETDLSQDFMAEEELNISQMSDISTNTTSSTSQNNSCINIKTIFELSPKKTKRICTICSKIFSIHTASNAIGKKYMAPFDINDSEARSLNEIENFLKPFYKITLEISSDTSNIRTSVLFMTKIEQILDETSKNHSDSDLKNAASKIYGWPSQKANVYDFSKDDMETQPYSVCMHNEIRKEAYEYPDLSRDEFIDYIKEPVAPASTNILDWWAKNSDFYPTLSLIAKDFFAQQTTSVPSERVFSKAVDFLTKKRNRMSGRTVKYCMCLNNWDVRDII
ncbi:unnamed protein product [Gordionus sp. m RMFG-2023]